MERAERRHEFGRPQTSAHAIYAPLQQRTATPARCEARNHRLGSGKWQERSDLAREIRLRSLVRRQLEPGLGCVDPSSNTLANCETDRHLTTGSCHHARIPRKRARQTMKEKRIFVYGASGHGKVVADILISKGESGFAGFVDDREQLWDTRIMGFPVLGDGQWLRNETMHSRVAVALGVGANEPRHHISERCSRSEIEILTVVHPAAVISRTARLGRGAVVMAGAIINPDATVGVGAIVNSGAVIEHEAQIGEYSHVSPKAAMAGASRLGSFAHLGLGAVVLQSICIGSYTIVGAGAVVAKNLPDQVVAIGVPARIHRRLGDEGVRNTAQGERIVA